MEGVCHICMSHQDLLGWKLYANKRLYMNQIKQYPYSLDITGGSANILDTNPLNIFWREKVFVTFCVCSYN